MDACLHASKPASSNRSPPPSRWRARGAATVAVALGALLAGCATAPKDGDAAATASLERLVLQADRWDKAIVRKDRAAIEANMAADFRQIDARGNVETRQSFVDDLVSPALEIDPYKVEEFDVRVYGNVALLSGRTQMTGRFQGRPFASHYRYIDIYVLQAGEWKIVSVQISPIPPK